MALPSLNQAVLMLGNGLSSKEMASWRVSEMRISAQIHQNKLLLQLSCGSSLLVWPGNFLIYLHSALLIIWKLISWEHQTVQTPRSAIITILMITGSHKKHSQCQIWMHFVVPCYTGGCCNGSTPFFVLRHMIVAVAGSRVALLCQMPLWEQSFHISLYVFNHGYVSNKNNFSVCEPCYTAGSPPLT